MPKNEFRLDGDASAVGPCDSGIPGSSSPLGKRVIVGVGICGDKGESSAVSESRSLLSPRVSLDERPPAVIVATTESVEDIEPEVDSAGGGRGWTMDITVLEGDMP